MDDGKTTITITYECCNSTYDMTTAIPTDGSALHNASTVDTVMMWCDAQHDADHPECLTTPNL